jgi:hypothetical protein
MARLTTTLLALSLLAGSAACQRDVPLAPADETEARASTSDADPSATTAASAPDDDQGVIAGKPPSTIAVPPADTPTPGIAAGAEIVYTCEDGGELHVAYSGNSATFALEDGRKVTLPRAESASKGGGDVYVGDTVGLQRLGNVVQVEQKGGAKRVCAESGGTA